MRKMILAVTAAALAVPTIPAAPAFARDGYYHGKTWRDSRGRLRCKRPNGTTGLIIGAAGGALAGRAIDSDDRVRDSRLGRHAGQGHEAQRTCGE